MWGISSLPALCRYHICYRCQHLLNSLKLSGLPNCFLCGLHRPVYTMSKIWEKKLSTPLKKDLESYWMSRLKNGHVNQNKGGNKYYVLSMFPYPSGRLHMGHVRVYTISDVMARYHRMTGKEVIHPMGWDAFGLPAENAAIERKELPDKWTYSNITHMRKQLDELGCSFDWDREFATCDPNYYKWTQYIFLKMYEAGLVYQKQAYVNWDPVDQTVLADEQIDENGCSWRSGAKAEKKLLKQWYIRTTAYSKSLVEGLSEVDKDLWRDIIALQKHWIGECDGCRVEMPLECKGKRLNDPFSLFTHTPEAMCGASHIFLSPEHPLNQHQYKISDCIESGVTRLSVEAVNPFTQQKLPLFVHEKMDFGPYLDSCLGIPCIRNEDREFAECHKLEFREVIHQDESGQGQIIDSGVELNCGGHVTSERSRDWLISRQRYWGTPIPIIHCPKRGAVPVAHEDLPVILPEINTLSGKGSSPLLQAEEWGRVKCPGCDCDSYGQRETDTMDTFVDSSWYFLRYLDPKNQDEPFSKDSARKYIPVDLYIGGKEHAIMHLYYARFFHHFLYDQGLVPTREPFVNLLTQGMVMGQSYKLKDSGRYIPPDQVDMSGKTPVEKGSGTALITDWEKMSKSKYNGVDPQDILDAHGSDATRLCILSNVAPKSDRHWSEEVFSGVVHWQSRIWSLVSAIIEARAHGIPDKLLKVSGATEEDIFMQRNNILKDVAFNMNTTFLLNVVISRLHALTNSLKKYSVNQDLLLGSREFEQALAELVIMVTPFALCFGSELWSGLQDLPYKLTDFNWEKPVLEQQWPSVDENYKLPLRVKMDSKVLYEVPLPMEIKHMDELTENLAIQLAQMSPDFNKNLAKASVLNTSLRLVPGYKAEINFNTNKKKKALKKTDHDKSNVKCEE